jgi:hypothetical protein
MQFGAKQCPVRSVGPSAHGQVLPCESGRDASHGRGRRRRRNLDRSAFFFRRACRERVPGSDLPVKAGHSGRLEGEKSMKYMLMMHAPKAGWSTAGIGTWPPKDIQAHIRFMMDLNARLKAAGELVDAQGLAGPEEAKLVRARADGSPDTDGPFAEAKEFLAGFWIVDVDSTERAYAIAAQASAAPGKGGAPLNMPIEVRQVMSAPPVDA